MIKFILPAAILLSLMISGQAFACDPSPHNYACDVEVTYQKKSLTICKQYYEELEVAQAQAKADACKQLCKGDAACVASCVAAAEFPVLRCRYVDGCAGWLGGEKDLACPNEDNVSDE